MRKVLIDTNVYSLFKRNDTRIVTSFRYLDYIGMDITVLAELYSGFKDGTKEKQNIRELEDFLNSSRTHILVHDALTAEYYAHVFSLLKRKGKPIPTNDIWIAAAAMQNGLALFTVDAHFTEIEGLILKRDF